MEGGECKEEMQGGERRDESVERREKREEEGEGREGAGVRQ